LDSFLKGGKEMAGKPATKKKVVVKKSAAPAKRPTAKTASRRTYGKGDYLVCGTCGLSVIVDEYGDVVGTEELICCGEVMKPKSKKAKAAKK
jgi:hypothetical protein